MQSKKLSYKAICDYDRLQRAFDSLHLEMTEENEERLINLHNHLIWRSYTSRNDDVADAILFAAIKEVMKEYSLTIEDIPVEFRCLACSCGKEE